MKHNLLYLSVMCGILSLYAGDLFAQENHTSFMAEGKKWNYHYKNLNGTEYDESLMTKGDTLIASRNCKKLYNGGSYQGAFYEEGGKVYFYAQGKDTPELIYNFNGKKGDLLLSMPFDREILAENVDHVTVNGRSFKRIATETYESGSHDSSADFMWVEGIGGMKHLLHNQFLPGDNYNFVSCELNGEVIFTSKDFISTSAEGTVGIHSIDNEKSATAKGDGCIYDLQGRKVGQRSEVKGQNLEFGIRNSELKPGIYIINGNKVVIK